MKCKKHPQYKVIRKPTADCDECMKMWEDKVNKLKGETYAN